VRSRVLLAMVSSAAIGLSVVGCGNGLASVSGTVTLDGEPIAGGSDVRGTVTFYRQDGTGTPAVGIIDSDGRYEMSTGSTDGVPPGEYAVAIAATRIIIPEPGATPSGRPITPRYYANAKESGLRADVEPGGNTFDFQLESK
jgi:hypothetical protein